MERIHEGYEYKDFEIPNSIEKKTICTKTGKLASSGACSSYTEYFAPGTAPTQSCPGHVEEQEIPSEEPVDNTEEPIDESTPQSPSDDENDDNVGAPPVPPTP